MLGSHAPTKKPSRRVRQTVPYVCGSTGLVAPNHHGLVAVGQSISGCAITQPSYDLTLGRSHDTMQRRQPAPTSKDMHVLGVPFQVRDKTPMDLVTLFYRGAPPAVKRSGAIMARRRTTMLDHVQALSNQRTIYIRHLIMSTTRRRYTVPETLAKSSGLLER